MRWVAVLALVLGIATLARAQEYHHHPPTADPTARIATTRPQTRPAEREEKRHEKEAGDEIRVTKHSMELDGRKLEYTATTGTLVQRDESGTAKADMFFVAYELTRPKGESAATRPVTFVFNGGPGAASVWLHLGAAGPKRIDIAPDGLPAAAPYHLVDNESSWLDATDLVFVDPVGTGYSRPAKGEKAQQFYGVEQDIKSMAAFIRLWTTRYRRWPSPKFLAGESYGTTRAAGLSEYLLEHDGIALNGIVLISSVLNFQVIEPSAGNELPFALYVPSYTAAAWYHKKLAPDLQSQDLPKLLAEVKSWAMGDYWVALSKGAALSDQGKQAIAQKLARYTGLSVDWVLKANLRIYPGWFMKQLLADRHELIGRFDSRITGFDVNPIRAEPEYDPSLARFFSAYTADFNNYVRIDLKYESDLPYEVLTSRVQPWNFGPAGNGYLYVADDLRDAILKNPQMHVLVASGWLDLATPFAATDYTIDHMGLAPELRRNIEQRVLRSRPHDLPRRQGPPEAAR